MWWCPAARVAAAWRWWARGKATVWWQSAGLVGGDDDGGVVRGVLHPILHRALAVGAQVVAPVGASHPLIHRLILEFNFQSVIDHMQMHACIIRSAVPFHFFS
jgi:hypothetical protein